jgi:outer membrane biosynthesis protein TonB
VAGQGKSRVTYKEECWPADPAIHDAVKKDMADGKASRGLKLPTKTKHVMPEYPVEAVKQGIEGIIVVKGTVDWRSGEPVELVATDVPEILSEATLKAVRQWRYRSFEIDKVRYDLAFKTVITFTLE